MLPVASHDPNREASIWSAAAGMTRIHPTTPSDRDVPALRAMHLLMVPQSAVDAAVGRPIADGRDNVTFLPALSYEETVSTGIPAHQVVLGFDPVYADIVCKHDGAIDLKPAIGVRHRKIESIARRLIELDGLGWAVAAINVMWIALVRTIARAFGNLPARNDDTWLNPRALERVVAQVTSATIAEQPVPLLAKAAGLSPSAFLRAFRGSTGATPGEFVLAIRIERASALLGRTNLPIADVAKRVGFKSATHFAATFRRRCGVSPTAFRLSSRTTDPQP